MTHYLSISRFKGEIQMHFLTIDIPQNVRKINNRINSAVSGHAHVDKQNIKDCALEMYRCNILKERCIVNTFSKRLRIDH